jgi:hypothetical protein
MELHHTMHKSGGRVTTIHSVGHETYKGVATWHFVGDVTWSDGTASKNVEIAPWALCYDSVHPGAREELNAVMEKMNSYLAEQGKWHNPKNKKDGRVVHWTPKLPQAAIAL